MASASVPLLMDNDVIAFGEEEEAQNTNKLKHPYVTLFHLAFRIAAIVVYLLCNLFSDSYIENFVTVILLLSIDFWIVKNITGRIMVGLRWWNYIDDNGDSHWIFESRKGAQQNRINSAESHIFWLALILCPVVWLIFLVTALFTFKFKWILLILIAIILNGANLYGYVRCKMGKNNSASTSDFIKKQMELMIYSETMITPIINSPAYNSNAPTSII